MREGGREGGREEMTEEVREMHTHLHHERYMYSRKQDTVNPLPTIRNY